MPRTTTSLGYALGTRPVGSPVAPALANARTILCLGDSITRGYLAGATYEGGGFRGPLASKIATAGKPWTMIGPYTDTGAHAGLNGRSISDVNTACATTIGAGNYRPDCIVLICGTNDAINNSVGGTVGYVGATSATNLGTLLATINTAEPSVRLVVASSIPTVVGDFGAYAAQVADLNGRIGAVLDASAIHAAGRMVRVPLGSYVTGGLVVGDGVHPSATGYGVIAGALWPAICNALGADAEW